jgi:hypothetical protein
MEDVMGEACSAYGRNKKCIQILFGNPEGETTWKT